MVMFVCCEGVLARSPVGADWGGDGKATASRLAWRELHVCAQRFCMLDGRAAEVMVLPAGVLIAVDQVM